MKELPEMFTLSKDVQALSSVGKRDPVAGHVQISDEGEAHGKLWGDLGDDVGGEVAGGEGGLAHQVEDRVGHLDQLAGGEVQLAKHPPFLLPLPSLSAPLHDDGALPMY